MISQIIKQETFVDQDLPLSLAFVGTEISSFILGSLPQHFNIEKQNSLEELYQYLTDPNTGVLPNILLLEADPGGNCFTFIEEIKKDEKCHELIIVLIAGKKNKEWKLRALQLKVQDYYSIPFPVEHLIERLSFLVKFKVFKLSTGLINLAEGGSGCQTIA